jgi:hypothetical protein
MSGWDDLGEAGLTELFTAYQAAFKARDREALAGFFNYPCLFTSDLGSGVRSRSVAEPGEYHPVAAMVGELYNRAGVTGGAPLETRVTRLTDAIVVVDVHWEIRAGEAPLYDFRAAYTVGRADGGWKICAIAQNEIPKLQAAAARARL